MRGNKMSYSLDDLAHAEVSFWEMMRPIMASYEDWYKRHKNYKRIERMKSTSTKRSRKKETYEEYWIIHISKVNFKVFKKYLSLMKPLDKYTFLIRMPQAIQNKFHDEMEKAEDAMNKSVEEMAA